MYFKEVLKQRLEIAEKKYEQSETVDQFTHWVAIISELEILIELHDEHELNERIEEMESDQ